MQRSELRIVSFPRKREPSVVVFNTLDPRLRGDDDHRMTSTIFERARRENRYVLLDLDAVWCHWCHVMDRTTYRNPKVVQLIGSQFIAVNVDQDSHPALSRRYEEYGWLATVVFGPDGTEIAKRRGYLKPEIMLSYLEAVLADPSPVRYRDSEPVREFASSPLLAERLRTELEARHLIKGQHSAGYFALSDAARVKRGVPAVDKNRYARKNGWMIYALATFHAATGDATALAQAIRAAHWVLAKRALPGGGFAHGERDRGGTVPRRHRRDGPRLSCPVPGHGRTRMAAARRSGRRLHRAALRQRRCGRLSEHAENRKRGAARTTAGRRERRGRAPEHPTRAPDRKTRISKTRRSCDATARWIGWPCSSRPRGATAIGIMASWCPMPHCVRR